jgi:acyl-CoA synthetase (AMP-forming)/AMP-acid ligase II
MEEAVSVEQLPEVLRAFYNNSIQLKDKIACGRILEDGIDAYTYQEFREQAEDFAGYLQTISKQGDRAILLAETSNEFLIAFYGCMLAGIVAVPSHVANPKKTKKLQHIIEDCGAKLVIGLENTINKFKSILPDNILVFSVENALKGCSYIEPEFSNNDIVFLQYTSGTTSDPKGVIVRFSNLLVNMKMIQESCGWGKDSIMCSWLPFYHDLGLIGMLLSPIFYGSSTYYLSPLEFVKKPKRWLQAISDLKATVAGGPNFAFDVCVQRVKDEDCKDFDFSSITTFFCGAEPIRLASLENFAKKYKPYNFNKNALYPCYGMAEVVLFATGVDVQKPIFWSAFDSKDLMKHKITPVNPESQGAVKLVGCGYPTRNSDAEVIVVNPETCLKIENQVGEIWISGSHVCSGYWNKEEISDRNFRAQLVGNDEKKYLKTGDLGFIYEGHLFISGRIKNLIIIGGKNIYPHDIETCINGSHELMQNGRSTAFSVLEDGFEHLICIKEINRNLYQSIEKHRETNDTDTKKIIHELYRKIQFEISEDNGVIAQDIFFMLQGRLNTTTSGKIQIQTIKQEYLKKSLVGFSLMELVKHH